MIKSVKFTNYKVLQDATLPLGPLTLIVGPNGSGKSTALQALARFRSLVDLPVGQVWSVGYVPRAGSEVAITVNLAAPHDGLRSFIQWLDTQSAVSQNAGPHAGGLSNENEQALNAELNGVRLYALDAHLIGAAVDIRPADQLESSGHRLAGVLDVLHSQEPERFAALNAELARWIPEFDQILLETPMPGQKAVVLRTKEGRHRIPATQLSQGTLLALALLTLAHIPNPPTVLCLEEPDRGLHPRLLRDVYDALIRLSSPDSAKEGRRPVQVIATTHSPYFLDLFRDHPEDVVISEKDGLFARFERLTDRKDVGEIIGSAPLGDVWYSGVLGGVPNRDR